MSKRIQGLPNRVLAMILAIVMVVSFLPVPAFAATESAVQMNLSDMKDVVTGEYVAFTVSATVSEALEEEVLCCFDFNDGDWSGVKLQYKDLKDESWKNLAAGESVDPATTDFRVKFETAGTYTFSVSLKTAEEELVKQVGSVAVAAKPSELATDFAEQTFVAGKATAFTFTATPNGYEGENVYGVIAFSNWDAVDKLEYQDGEGKWIGLTKDDMIGPTAMTKDATSMRVTFNRSGSYKIQIALIKAEDTSIELCKVEETVTVTETVRPVVQTIIGVPENWVQSAVIKVTATDEGGSGIAKIGYATVNDIKKATFVDELQDDTIQFEVKENKTYYIWAVDGNGNESEVKKVVVDKIDNQTPTLNVSTNPDSWTNNQVTIAIGAKDTSGVIVKYNTADDMTTATVLELENGEAKLMVTSAYDGLYYVWAIDGAGNVSEAEVCVQIDKTNPTVAIITKPSEDWTNQNVVVEGTVNDTHSGIAEVVFGIGDKPENATGVDALEGAEYRFTVTQNGVYNVWSKDKAGNFSAPMTIEISNIDKVVPVVESIEAPNTWQNGDVKVTVKASDDLSGVAKVVYAVTGSEEKTEAAFAEGVYTFTVSAADFKNSISVWAVDAAGNVSAEKKVNLKMDKTAPVVQNAVADPSGATNKSVTVSGKVSDNLAGVAAVYYGETAEFSENLAKATLNKDSYSFVVGNGAQKYDTTYYVWSVDQAGNVSECVDVKVYIDLTAPVVTAVAKPSQATNRKVTVTATPSDDHSGVATVYYSINSTFGISMEEATKNDDGTYSFVVSKEFNGTYYIWAVDAAGNYNETPAQVKVHIDTTPATAEIKIQEKVWDKLLQTITFGLYSNDAFDVVITADDKNGSGVKDISYYISGVALERDQVESITEWVTYSESFTVSKEQRMIVYARVVDHAGNVEYFNSDGVILDKTQADITLKPSASAASDGNNAYYNGSVTVDISVVDSKMYSGIKTIEYWITKDGIAGESVVLYSFGYDGSYSASGEWTISGSDVESENGSYTGIPSLEMLKGSWNGSITVPAVDNNSSDVVVTIRVTDNAGNVSKADAQLDIDITAPVVELRYEDAGKLHNNKYFDNVRTATIVVTERAGHFVEPTVYFNDEEVPVDAQNYIRITAKDAKGEWIGTKPVISWIPTGDVAYTATIDYDVDANYTFDIKVMDRATNVNDGISVVGEAPYDFTVDTKNPEASLEISGASWKKVLEILTFGIYSNDQLVAKATAVDDTSPIKVEYYVVYGSDAPAVLNPEMIEGWMEVELSQLESLLTIENSEQFVVYLKVTDLANHVHYVSTDGTIVDRDVSGIVLTPAEPVNDDGVEGIYGYYNGDVTVDIQVADVAEWSSGIKSVEYWITKDGVAGESVVLYSFGYDGSYDASQNWVISGSDVEGENGSYTGMPTYEMLKKAWNGQITISAEDNNSCNAIVIVQVTDNAGNVSDAQVALDIDVTAPVVELTYEDTAAKANDKYFQGVRTATVTVTERKDHFVVPAVYFNGDEIPADAQNYIHITAVNASGEDVEFAPEIQWNTVVNEEDPQNEVHTAIVVYEADANYTFDIKVMDKAMNGNDGVATDVDNAPYEFTVDNTAPVGSLIAVTKTASGVWEEIVTALTFGLYDAKRITVTATASDATSPVKVEYYKVSGEAAATLLTREQILAVEDWTLLVDNTGAVVEDTNVMTVRYYEQFVVYLKLTDNANNVQYISSAGAILDNLPPLEPVITVRGEQKPANGIYTDDVVLDVSVAEQVIDGVYSGLKSVRYEIYNYSNPEDQQLTQSGTLLEFKLEDFADTENQGPTQADLIREFTTVGNELVDGQINENGEKDVEDYIVVDAELNNSNNIVVWIIAEDNAGNQIREALDLKIDIAAPQIIVEYDNNQYDSGFYYDADRTATIKIIERNFDPAKVMINITNTDEIVPEIPTEWTAVDPSEWNEMIPEDMLGQIAEGNGDRTVHVATIHYSADGDYKFSVECEDMVGWSCGNASEEHPEKKYDNPVTAGVNAFAFTIDKTLPEIRVTSDNNQALNGNYFKAYRTLTVTIIEHNFPLNDIDRVEFIRTADRGGVVSNVSWRHNNDTHIATIQFDTDGDYTFDVSMLDLAGNENKPVNYGSTVAAKDFIIDTTYEDMITIGGVETGKAYGYGVDLIPTIDISDINLESYTISLIGVQKDHVIDLTEDAYKLLKAGAENVNGALDLFEVVRERDGIYTLTVSSKDKAGNVDDQTAVFTVNRFGSVYVYDDYLMGLVADGGAYVKAIEEDLVIDEYNADKLLAGTVLIEITCDGKPLEDVNWTATPEINDLVKPGSSGWYQYKYTIPMECFAADGVYKITVSSMDATGNASENNRFEEMSITFRVDSTAAEITSIVGLEDAIINAPEKEVAYTIYDSVGLKAVRIYVDNELLHEIVEFNGDLHNYSGNFVLMERNAAQTVRIVVEDLAGNITDTAEKTFTSAYEFNTSVTVSTNVFVRWYANKPLFFGSIAAVVAAAGGMGVAVAAKRKKKEEDEDSSN